MSARGNLYPNKVRRLNDARHVEFVPKKIGYRAGFIKRVTLTNFMNHQSLDLELKPGVNIITGVIVLFLLMLSHLFPSDVSDFLNE